MMLGQNQTERKVVQDHPSQWESHAQESSAPSFPPNPNWWAVNTLIWPNILKSSHALEGPPTSNLHTPFDLGHGSRCGSMDVHLPDHHCNNLDCNECGAMGKDGLPARTDPTHSQLSALLPEIQKSLLELGSLESPDLIILLIDTDVQRPDPLMLPPAPACSVTKYSIQFKKWHVFSPFCPNLFCMCDQSLKT